MEALDTADEAVDTVNASPLEEMVQSLEEDAQGATNRPSSVQEAGEDHESEVLSHITVVGF